MSQTVANIVLTVLTILLILSLGSNVFLLMKSNQEYSQFQSQQRVLETKVNQQKQDKDRIYQLGEQQGDTNDKLVAQQQKVLEEVDNYLREIEQSFRFVNTTPQILPTISEDELRIRRNALEKTIVDLDQIMDENSDRKRQFQDNTNTLYKNAGEDKPNRANPREGIRE